MVLKISCRKYSILRNPVIAQLCFIRKYIEMLGSGTLRMIRDCKRNGFKPPSWVEKGDIMRLTFPGVSHSKKNEGVIEGVNEGVKQELQQVLLFLRSNPLSKAPEIAAYVEKGVSTIERYLKLLKDNGLIEYIGAPKTGGYQMKKFK